MSVSQTVPAPATASAVSLRRLDHRGLHQRRRHRVRDHRCRHGHAGRSARPGRSALLRLVVLAVRRSACCSPPSSPVGSATGSVRPSRCSPAWPSSSSDWLVAGTARAHAAAGRRPVGAGSGQRSDEHGGLRPGRPGVRASPSGRGCSPTSPPRGCCRPSIGPPVSAWLTEQLSWHWVFFAGASRMVLGGGLLVLPTLRRLIRGYVRPEPEPDAPSPAPLWAAGLVAIGAAAAPAGRTAAGLGRLGLLVAGSGGAGPQPAAADARLLQPVPRAAGRDHQSRPAGRGIRRRRGVRAADAGRGAPRWRWSSPGRR